MCECQNTIVVGEFGPGVGEADVLADTEIVGDDPLRGRLVAVGLRSRVSFRQASLNRTVRGTG
jgi:hypothetical protein